MNQIRVDYLKQVVNGWTYGSAFGQFDVQNTELQAGQNEANSFSSYLQTALFVQGYAGHAFPLSRKMDNIVQVSIAASLYIVAHYSRASSNVMVKRFCLFVLEATNPLCRITEVVLTAFMFYKGKAVMATTTLVMYAFSLANTSNKMPKLIQNAYYKVFHNDWLLFGLSCYTATGYTQKVAIAMFVIKVAQFFASLEKKDPIDYQRATPVNLDDSVLFPDSSFLERIFRTQRDNNLTFSANSETVHLLSPITEYEAAPHVSYERDLPRLFERNRWNLLPFFKLNMTDRMKNNMLGIEEGASWEVRDERIVAIAQGELEKFIQRVKTNEMKVPHNNHFEYERKMNKITSFLLSIENSFEKAEDFREKFGSIIHAGGYCTEEVVSAIEQGARSIDLQMLLKDPHLSAGAKIKAELYFILANHRRDLLEQEFLRFASLMGAVIVKIETLFKRFFFWLPLCNMIADLITSPVKMVQAGISNPHYLNGLIIDYGGGIGIACERGTGRYCRSRYR